MGLITLNATKVAYISEYYSDQNFNNPTNLFVGLFNQPNSSYESFLKFDLSSIPVGSTINNAILKLYVNKLTTPSTSNQYIYVTPNTTDFDAAAITWDNQPVNNNSPFVVVSIQESNVGSYVDLDIKRVVQGWVQDPSSNYGINLTGQTKTDAVISISGNENSAQTPELVIQYTEPNDSNIVIGDPQTLPFTVATTVDSAPITSNNVPVSFQIETNVGNATTTVDYIIQVSNDGQNWYNVMDSHIAAAAIPSPGVKYMLTTSALAKEYKVEMVIGGTVAAGNFVITPITPVK